MNDMATHPIKRNPWSWIPTLYFAEGLPYVAVMTIAVIMYKRLGLSNTEIALYTSWLYLPWTVKPLWSPFVDLVKTKRSWVIAMQGFIAAGFAGIAFFIPTAHYVQFTLAFFWLLAFSSATHDIAADGFYMFGLNNKEQSFFGLPTSSDKAFSSCWQDGWKHPGTISPLPGASPSISLQDYFWPLPSITGTSSPTPIPTSNVPDLRQASYWKTFS